MKLQAIRGRNQRGISYVSDSIGLPPGTVRLSIGQRSVLSTLKENQRVSTDQIVLDMRHYDYLLQNSQDEIQVEIFEDKLPICTELVLSVSSKRTLDAKRIIEAFSQKIEDLEPYLDGLILETGKEFFLEDLGVLVTPLSLKPISQAHNASKVMWKRVMKIYLKADDEIRSFNVIAILELGASSWKDDIAIPGTELHHPRYEVSKRILRLLAQNLSNNEVHFASVAYSKDVSLLAEDEISSLSVDTVERLDEWINKRLEDHKGNASNLGFALETGIEQASKMSTSHCPTFIILFSSGTYSIGVNPIPIVRNLLSGTEGIFLACLGIGKGIDLSLLEAIAQERKGIFLRIDEMSQVDQVILQLVKWIKSEV